VNNVPCLRFQSPQMCRWWHHNRHKNAGTISNHILNLASFSKTCRSLSNHLFAQLLFLIVSKLPKCVVDDIELLQVRVLRSSAISWEMCVCVCLCLCVYVYIMYIRVCVYNICMHATCVLCICVCVLALCSLCVSSLCVLCPWLVSVCMCAFVCICVCFAFSIIYIAC
jgi:hypothetical protein